MPEDQNKTGMTVKDVIEEFSMENCKNCGWDKFCIKPPEMTAEQMKQKRDKEREKIKNEKGDASGALMGMMMGSIIDDGFTKPRACPLFLKRLQASSKLSQEIKHLMLKWED